MCRTEGALGLCPRTLGKSRHIEDECAFQWSLGSCDYHESPGRLLILFLMSSRFRRFAAAACYRHAKTEDTGRQVGQVFVGVGNKLTKILTSACIDSLRLSLIYMKGPRRAHCKGKSLKGCGLLAWDTCIAQRACSCVGTGCKQRSAQELASGGLY